MSDATWYVLIWVAPVEPRDAAFFAYEGPFATRDEAVSVARAAREATDGDRFVRVIERADAPTGEQWDEAEDVE